MKQEESKHKVGSHVTATPPPPKPTTILLPPTQQGPHLCKTARIKAADPLMTIFQTSSLYHYLQAPATYHLGRSSSRDPYITTTRIVTCTLGRNLLASILFDSGVDYSFIFTNFLPLTNMKPSVISPGYEIEIASGLKIETNKIVHECRLELEDLVPEVMLVAKSSYRLAPTEMKELSNQIKELQEK
nr:hypothetical protein [Tanacetum cinerariifolium]